eukprot:TRINITY_DN5522_c0_g4_i1.p1 TRINITY_DN5522_c0_g4~~TRINITY_DN5522_c0_g4_i1.p1  ORF type:complete len:324 (+),score=70.64 TRINITY_DN5522_c0_g4_i1:39-974(+)
MAETDVLALLQSLKVGHMEESSGIAPPDLNLNSIMNGSGVVEKDKDREKDRETPEWWVHQVPQPCERAESPDLVRENILLRQRVMSLEKENNELKKQLSRQALRTPPPMKQEMQPLQTTSPLIVRAQTPTTPTATATINTLSAAAPSFIPIANASTGSLSPSAYTTLPPSLTPAGTAPQPTSPGPKTLVNNVCRHWLVNRCTYGNDCRFVHPPTEASVAGGVPAKQQPPQQPQQPQSQLGGMASLVPGIVKKKEDVELLKVAPHGGANGRHNEILSFTDTFHPQALVDKPPQDELVFRHQPLLYTAASTTA